jgi:hypothetical protein
MKLKITIFLLVITIILLSIITTGCGEYKQVSITRVGVTFSFEYPSAYQDRSGSLKEEYTQNEIFLESDERSDKGSTDKVFLMQILTKDTLKGLSYSNAKEDLEKDLNIYSGWSPSAEYKLLERSNIMIDNIQGEMITFQCNDQFPSRFGTYLKIVKKVYFDYKEMVWVISFSYYSEVANVAKEEFEHILSTFKFLN